MLISVHAPKTAGTSFRLFIERNVDRAAAFDYGDVDVSSPIVRAARAALDRDDAAEARSLLTRGGVELLHGHMVLHFAPVFPDAPVLTWLRDPLARTVSEFLHLRRAPHPGNPLSQRLASGDASFEDCLAANASFYRDVLDSLGDRPVAVLITELAEDGASAFRDALGWRGDLAVRNAAPSRDAKAARRLLAEHAGARDGVLKAETDLFRSYVEQWRAGPGRMAAVEALRSGPRRRPAGLFSRARLRMARHAVGTLRESLLRGRPSA